MYQWPRLGRAGFHLECSLDEGQRVTQPVFVIPVDLAEHIPTFHRLTDLSFQIQSYRRIDYVVHPVSTGPKSIRRQSEELSIAPCHEPATRRAKFIDEIGLWQKVGVADDSIVAAV